MKVTSYLILTCVFFLLTGCNNNLLVSRLKDHGVTPENTTKLKFVSSPGAFGPDVFVTTDNREVIKSVWTRIYSATPTDYWAACGEHKVEFHTSAQAEKPAATMLLNTTNAAHLEGDYWYHLDAHHKDYYGLWRCPGLEKLIMWHLRKEYERRKTGSKHIHLQYDFAKD